MRVISIWQPWASLLVLGHKTIETRGWPCPPSVIGERIGIAATKNILLAQRRDYEDEEFQRFYRETGLPPLDELPLGCVLGSAIVNSCDPIDQELVDDITDAEEAFGVYQPGRYAWRMRGQQAFGPYLAKGAQGLWKWTPPNDVAAPTQDNRAPQGAPTFRRALSPALRPASVPGA